MIICDSCGISLGTKHKPFGQCTFAVDEILADGIIRSKFDYNKAADRMSKDPNYVPTFAKRIGKIWGDQINQNQENSFSNFIKKRYEKDKEKFEIPW